MDLDSSMAKLSNKSKRSPVASSAAMGKGKVTQIQIAFIVERFLAANNYSSTLAAFRSEASDLFSKTKGKEVTSSSTNKHQDQAHFFSFVFFSLEKISNFSCIGAERALRVRGYLGRVY